MQSPQPGQVLRMDVEADGGAPIMASVTPIAVIP
jgi:hypothetical protein